MQQVRVYYRFVKKKNISIELIKEGSRFFIVIRQQGEELIKDEISLK